MVSQPEGLISSPPMQDQAAFAKAFYDRISRHYDALSDASERQARSDGIEALAVASGERVIELGCGTGGSLAELTRRSAPRGHTCGVDISMGMLGVSAEKIAAAGSGERVLLVCADARRLPTASNTFDCAFSSFTLELFEEEDRAAVLAEAKRILKGDGRIAIVSMAISEGHPSLIERGYVWLHRHFPHIVDCRPIDAASELSRAGFEIDHTRRVEMWTLPVDIVVAGKTSDDSTP